MTAPDLSSWINPEVCLSLGGGSYHGAFGVGVCKAFAKRLGPEGGGEPPTNKRLPGSIFGASVGAMTGSKIVADGWRAASTEANWLELERVGAKWLFNTSYISMGWRAFWSQASLFDNANLKRLIDGYRQKASVLPGLDALAVIGSPVNLYVPVMDETETGDYEKEYVIFSNRDKLFEANPEIWRSVVLAAASPPGIFDPVDICGRKCSDAFYVKFRRLLESGVKTIFLVFNDFPEGPHSWVLKYWVERMISSHFSIHDKLIEMFLRYISGLYPDLRIYRMGSPLLFLQRFDKENANPAPRFDPFGNKLPDIIIITPDRPLPELGHLNFKPGAIKAAISHGEERANAVLDALGW